MNIYERDTLKVSCITGFLGLLLIFAVIIGCCSPGVRIGLCLFGVCFLLVSGSGFIYLLSGRAKRDSNDLVSIVKKSNEEKRK